MKMLIKRKPRYGDQRERAGFLFLPKLLPRVEGDSYREFRWLERAIWSEQYSTFRGWYATYWVDENKI